MRTGKNLASPYTHEQNGVKVEYENGTFKITGTASATFSLRIINYMVLNGTYTYSLREISSSNIAVWFWNSTSQTTDPQLNSEHLTATKTYSADKISKYFFNEVFHFLNDNLTILVANLIDID